MGKTQTDKDLPNKKKSDHRYFNVKFRQKTFEELEDEWRKVNCDTDGRLLEGKESRGAFFGRVFDDSIIGLGKLSVENEELKKEVAEAKSDDEPIKPKSSKKLKIALITAIVLCIVLFAWGLYNRNQLKDFV